MSTLEEICSFKSPLLIPGLPVPELVQNHFRDCQARNWFKIDSGSSEPGIGSENLYKATFSETMNLNNFVVVTLYPNGEMGRDSGEIWFRSATPMVFQMQSINTLEELKAVILRNMGVAGGTMLVKRVAYRLLNIFPPNQFKFKIF
ncbi:hypothetical protein PIB30_068130 [Stylosanthes scabra]|uniref:Uncharacterized protein n=1 Tax=Stylosanthes scabra TaxID=79078 RepID=A0ABU6VM87_9FABA|nr:hypothetical protein [Stylosanthes scabra]